MKIQKFEFFSNFQEYLKSVDDSSTEVLICPLDGNTTDYYVIEREKKLDRFEK